MTTEWTKIQNGFYATVPAGAYLTYESLSTARIAIGEDAKAGWYVWADGTTPTSGPHATLEDAKEAHDVWLAEQEAGRPSNDVGGVGGPRWLA